VWPARLTSTVRTCNEKSCKFFLWDTDAQPRELAALQNDSRTEAARAVPTTPSRPRAHTPPTYTPNTGPFDSSRKRARSSFDDDEDEFDFDPEDGPVYDAVLSQVANAMETPSKKAKTESFATPLTVPARRKLPWQRDDQAKPKSNGLQTPQTESRIHDVFRTPAAAPVSTFVTPSITKQSDPASSQTITPGSSPVNTPTPVRFKDAGTNGTDSELAQDVWGVLQEGNAMLDEPTRRKLTAALSKHATIAEGIRKGREVARTAIKAKDAKNTELAYRVNTLEAELEAERATVRHLQWKAESGHMSD
jgi:hypothetical protein